MDRGKVKESLKNLLLVIMDIVAVNAAYLLALWIRYHTFGSEVSEVQVKFLPAFFSFAPFYTVICIMVFFFFGLYRGVWQYIGWNDINHILLASAITIGVQVLGTIIFVRRMPWSYYGLGALFQTAFLLANRMSYRILSIERKKLLRKKSPEGTVMIIGSGEDARKIIRYLEENTPQYYPVCIVDNKTGSSGITLDRVPIIGGIESIWEGIERYKVSNICISDPFLSNEDRNKITELCKERQIHLEDYSGYIAYLQKVASGEGSSVSDALLQIVKAPATVSIKGAEKRIIPFSPPDIGEKEIGEVVEAMKSGWITTGPRTKMLERRLAAYIETGKVDVDVESEQERWSNRVVCLGSATASEELNLRILGVGSGDEVIVPAYTYTASASAAIHCGATVKFVDIQRDGDQKTHAPEMDYDALGKAITSKTKAIITVDLGGCVCDYDRVFEIVERKRNLYVPIASDGTPLSELSSKIQRGLGRVAVVADCAHALGSSRQVERTGKNSAGDRKALHYCGDIADFTDFSFHAVKNFTTAEGGASTWCLPKSVYDQGVTDADIYHFYQLLSLHGQSKDALNKTKAGAWEYDIIGPWYKCNMTDIMAAIGLRQLDRYPELMERRSEIIRHYDELCDDIGVMHLSHHVDGMDSSNHLYLVRIPGATVEQRNEIIREMAEAGIATNVHYKPLPMMTAYKNLGWDIKDFPNTYGYYEDLLTLPLHTLLSDDDVNLVCKTFRKVVIEVRKAA